jgi:hypothetical protein
VFQYWCPSSIYRTRLRIKKIEFFYLCNLPLELQNDHHGKLKQKSALRKTKGLVHTQFFSG